MSNTYPNTHASGRGGSSCLPRLRLFRSAAGAAFVVALSIAAAGPGLAVECGNGGAGSNPAGNDGANSDNTACGQNAVATGSGARNTAVGYSADSGGANGHNVAFGDIAIASGDGGLNLAVGYNAAAGGANAVNTAIGGQARAEGEKGTNVAIGFIADARGASTKNVSVGTAAHARGIHSTAIGSSATANFDLGAFAPDGFDNAVAIGSQASALNKSSIAAGKKAAATARYAIAAGALSKATKKESVAIGYKSVASAANTVSVGAKHRERRIVNVAKAKNATDAVNLRQVKDLVKAAADRSADAADASDKSATAIGELRREVQALRELVVLQKQRIDDLEAGRVVVAHAM